jgi:hypothetical protein
VSCKEPPRNVIKCIQRKEIEKTIKVWKVKGIEENGWKVKMRNKQISAEFV